MIGNFLLDKADNVLERRSGGDGCEDEPYASFIVRRRVRQRNHSITRPAAAVAALLPHINPLWPLCHFLSSVFLVLSIILVLVLVLRRHFRFRCRFSLGSIFVLVSQVRTQALPLWARLSLTS